MNAADRIREQACGCRYDVATGAITHFCQRHALRWVLRSSESYRGRPLWFAKMTGIGPMTTAKLVEAARFASQQEAALSPAMRFTLTSFTPEQLP